MDIQILAVNEWGQHQGNSLAVVGHDLPLLQDEDANHDSHSDAWSDWNVVWRDLVFVNGQLERIGAFNLTTYDLGRPEYYEATKDILVGIAQQRAFWQNPENRLDVNDDGLVTPVQDVLRLINELNQPKTIDSVGRLPLPMPPHQPPSFFDVNGDGFLSPAADILPVINFLNKQASGGEGEDDFSADDPVRARLTDAAIDSWPLEAGNEDESASSLLELPTDQRMPREVEMIAADAPYAAPADGRLDEDDDRARRGPSNERPPPLLDGTDDSILIPLPE